MSNYIKANICSYIERQFSTLEDDIKKQQKLSDDLGENRRIFATLKITSDNAHTNWLSITPEQLQQIKLILGEVE